MPDEKTVPVREYEWLDEDKLSGAPWKRCQEIADDPRDERGEPYYLLRRHGGKIKAQNYVGVLQVAEDKTIEILPKVELSGGKQDEQDERNIFYKMLRHYRKFRFAQMPAADIDKLKNFDMLEVFIYIFLQDVLKLIKVGIVNQYCEDEDNLPYLKGRLQFAQHSRVNAANRARFYVRYDEYSPDHAANRLIYETLKRLRCHQPENQQLCWQLITHFEAVSRCENLHRDWQQWQQCRSQRNMLHYKTVMPWVELFLFEYGLATFHGKHENKSLLFPMPQVFEDFVAHHFTQTQEWRVQLQSPQQYLVTRSGENNENKPMFKMKPDISLINLVGNSDKVEFILDTKWKEIDSNKVADKFDISQGDIYQLFAYGKSYGCKAVVLIYPRSEKFKEAIHFRFNDKEDSDLQLICHPFDVENPKDSVNDILKCLNKSAKAGEAPTI